MEDSGISLKHSSPLILQGHLWVIFQGPTKNMESIEFYRLLRGVLAFFLSFGPLNPRGVGGYSGIIVTGMPECGKLLDFQKVLLG